VKRIQAVHYVRIENTSNLLCKWKSFVAHHEELLIHRGFSLIRTPMQDVEVGNVHHFFVTFFLGCVHPHNAEVGSVQNFCINLM